MFITKKHLPRRTVLRGLGVTLALPWLEGMVPALTALSQTAAAPARRLGVFYVPNGVQILVYFELVLRTEFPLKVTQLLQYGVQYALPLAQSPFPRPPLRCSGITEQRLEHYPGVVLHR